MLIGGVGVVDGFGDCFDKVGKVLVIVILFG